ncbi:phage gp6-like head-tail connector protein [Streptomyces sp. NPDC050095]|uniref:phage gp6-like head-tail connector protein n=1 Tax=unclassified Streptomyces TaxID=2593676 RepID=UPI003436E22A
MEAARIGAFLDDATGLIQDHCGSDFQRHTNETFDLEIEDGRGLLAPSFFPSLTVSSVTLQNPLEDQELTAGQWKLKGPALYVNAAFCGTATVVASWGWASCPAAVKAAICSEVIRWLSVSPGTVMEKTGDLEVQYAVSAYSSGLSEAAKSMLRPYRRSLASISLSRD